MPRHATYGVLLFYDSNPGRIECPDGREIPLPGRKQEPLGRFLEALDVALDVIQEDERREVVTVIQAISNGSVAVRYDIVTRPIVETSELQPVNDLDVTELTCED